MINGCLRLRIREYPHTSTRRFHLYIDLYYYHPFQLFFIIPSAELQELVNLEIVNINDYPFTSNNTDTSDIMLYTLQVGKLARRLAQKKWMKSSVMDRQQLIRIENLFNNLYVTHRSVNQNSTNLTYQIRLLKHIMCWQRWIIFWKHILIRLWANTQL